MGWGQPHEPRAVDRLLPAVRADLVERGLLIPRERLLSVLRLLEIDDPHGVIALSIDQLQVTVVRRRKTRGQLADGHEIRQHIPIIDMPEEGP